MKKWLLMLVGITLPTLASADVFVQARYGASLQQELDMYLNTYHMYEEFQDKFYVMDFKTGAYAGYSVTQTNPLEPRRVVLPIQVPSSKQAKMTAARALYLQAEVLLKDNPIVPADVVSGAYQLQGFSSARNRLEDWLAASGAAIGWKEHLERAVTTLQSDLLQVREVLLETTLPLSDGGRVQVQLIQTQNNFKYVIIRIIDKNLNILPLEPQDVISNGPRFSVNGDAYVYDGLEQILNSYGFRIVTPNNFQRGRVTTIECSTGMECVVKY